MAFTGWEFTRGALMAWVWFIVLFAPVAGLHLVALIVPDAPGSWGATGFSSLGAVPGLVLIAYIFVAPWSLAGLVVGMPFAYGLGLALRRNDNRVIHVTAFAILGLVVGAVATTAGAMATLPSAPVLPSTIVWAIAIYAVVAAVAVALGWLFTASRALQADAQADPGT